MLDSDLAEIYGVETKALNRAVKRNISRFPIDFMLKLTSKEWKFLKYQIGTSCRVNMLKILKFWNEFENYEVEE